MSSNNSNFLLWGAVAAATVVSAITTAAVTTYVVDKELQKKQDEDFWLLIIANGSAHFRRSKRLKEMVRQNGIPPHLRAKVWPCISGSIDLQSANPGVYHEILRSNSDGVSISTDQIDRDVGRTFPECSFFKKKEGIDSLRRILEAFSWRHTQIGYCQSLNFVVASLLLAGLKEEQAFWIIEVIITRLLPPDFYSPSLADLRRDLLVLEKLIEIELPKIHRHFRIHDVSSSLFTIQWFLCLFVNVFPLELSLRFLDCFLYEGSKALFRVSLGLLKLHEDQIITKPNFECLSFCKNLPTSTRVTKFEDLFQPNWDIGEVSSSRIKELRESVTIDDLQKN